MVPLSNNTIERRIHEISASVLEQTIAAVKRSGIFSLQLDETTDIGNNAQLMVFVWYWVTKNYFLFCRPLSMNTTGEQILKEVDSFFCKHKLGEPSMMGNTRGFMSFVKKKKQKHIDRNVSIWLTFFESFFSILHPLSLSWIDIFRQLQ